MKWISYLLFFCTPWILPAQEWQNICSPGVTFYQKNGGLIEAFRVDSTDLSQLPDTLFLSYHSIRDTAGDCYDTTGGSFLGLMVRKTPAGIFRFYNRHNDSLTLHTTEGAGYSWKFMTDPAGNYIEATIVGVILDSVCETTDSVKVIAFQAKDKNGNNISQVLNGNYIKLSKHFGLTRMMELYSAPFSPDMYILIGKACPAIGLQNLTWNEVYDYDVGDEFYYYDHESEWAWDIYYYTIKKILTREDFPELHKVVYTMEYCQRKDLPGPPFHLYYWDTVTQTNTFQSDTSFIEEMPREFIRYDWDAPIFERINPTYNGRQSHKKSIGVQYGNGCWNPPFESIESFTVTAGLGRTRSEHVAVYYSYISQLVYFKKGTETWGTPFATGCNTLVPVETRNAKSEIRISIFPNPARDQITVQIENFKTGDFLEFSLFDFLGREVYQTVIRQNEVTLNRPPIPNGLYIWKVTGEVGTATGKLLFE